MMVDYTLEIHTAERTEYKHYEHLLDALQSARVFNSCGFRVVVRKFSEDNRIVYEREAKPR